MTTTDTPCTEAGPPPPAIGIAGALGWVPVTVNLQAEHLDLLRRWALDEDRPLRLHLQRILRLAAQAHREATDAA